MICDNYEHSSRQQVYDRYDALSDACWNLKQGMEALGVCRSELEPDAIAALQDITDNLERELNALQAQLERMDAHEA